MTSAKDQYFSKTLEKGLAILNLFNLDQSFLTLSEISRLSGINKTSTYRLTNTLVQLGYLKKNTRNKLLSLGPRAFVLGHYFFHGFNLLQSLKPIIDKNFFEHKISVDSALFHENSLISLYRREMPNLIHFRLPLIMFKLYARAMGKAVLANLEEPELNDFLNSVKLKKLTPYTRVDKQDILDDIQLTKNRGYSINNQEYVKGLICIGAPLINHNCNRVVGAVSLDFTTAEFSLEDIQHNFPQILTKLANECSDIITSVDY
ncbi:MAG: IclR family transcriptional regulator [Desulfobulbaceae bacterium]|nr:IclR family transcriptional regulator [Desulfobulbaceae bacterium]